ncbi:hypothetical protein Bca4012_012214 [Brassica carinata]
MKSYQRKPGLRQNHKRYEVEEPPLFRSSGFYSFCRSLSLKIYDFSGVDPKEQPRKSTCFGATRQASYHVLIS